MSPDGRNVVFVAGAETLSRSGFDRSPPWPRRPIPGTEGGAFPFWSPDSRFIGFFADGKLKKVQIAGGPPTVLCDAPAGRGGTWSRDNVIVFAPGVAVTRASSACQARAESRPSPRPSIRRPAKRSHRWPHFLPDGHHFLYTASTGTCCPPTKPAIIRVGSLDPGAADVTLLQAESSALYASGHVLFARSDTLMAQPFDPDARQSTGDAFPASRARQHRGKPLYGRVGVGEWHAGVRAGRHTGGPTIDLVRSRRPRRSARWVNRRRTTASRCHQMNAALPSGWEPGRWTTATSGSSISPVICGPA